MKRAPPRKFRTLRREVIEPALNRHQGRLIKTTDDGQGTDLLERRVWDALSDRVIMASRRLVWPFRGIFLTRISPATMHRLPTVYPYRYFAEDGGLMSYGIDLVDQYRRAARYVHRIFHGEKPDELPVQAPAKFELVINHATAKAIGLSVPFLAYVPRGRGDRIGLADQRYDV